MVAENRCRRGRCRVGELELDLFHHPVAKSLLIALSHHAQSHDLEILPEVHRRAAMAIMGGVAADLFRETGNSLEVLIGKAAAAGFEIEAIQGAPVPEVLKEAPR